MFNAAYPIDRLNPASYNPRKIDEESKQALRDSIASLGIIRPIIARSDGTIMAGHQRTNAIRSLGYETAPVYIIDDVSESEEIRFNQLHNASDLEISEIEISVPPGNPGDWVEVAPRFVILGRDETKFASQKNEVMRLLNRHGQWSSCVATESGQVIAGGIYAKCCRTLGMPVLVRYVNRSQASEVSARFGRAYGRFSYAHLTKTTYFQSMAQRYRLRGDAKEKSRTYENFVLPKLTKQIRVLDFGCGQGDYVNRFSGLGYNIIGVEFYRRGGASNAIDVKAVNEMIDVLCSSLSTYGRFDMVVCDSVLNSVDSVQAERDVLTCVNAFCRPGGTIVFSCRNLGYEIQGSEAKSKVEVKRRRLIFLDDEGFSAVHQGQGWLYQKFHSDSNWSRLGRAFIGKDAKISKMTGTLFASGVKSTELGMSETLDSIGREFDLPLPGQRRWGRSKDAIEAFQKSLTLENR